MIRPAINSAFLLLAAFVLASCASAGSPVQKRLDPLTGATVRRAAVPIIMYRDNSAYAAHARSFVYMGPVEVNRSGDYAYYLWFGIWNTMRDEERWSQDRDGFESVVLFVDGDPLPLELAGWAYRDIGVSERVYEQPVAGAADAFYRVTLDQIRLMAAARDIELHTGAGGRATFLPWDGQGAAEKSLREFAAYGYD